MVRTEIDDVTLTSAGKTPPNAIFFHTVPPVWAVALQRRLSTLNDQHQQQQQNRDFRKYNVNHEINTDTLLFYIVAKHEQSHNDTNI